MARRATLTLAALGLSLGLVPSALALGPTDFAVQLAGGPQVSGPSGVTPQCTPVGSPIPTSVECPIDYDWSAVAVPLTGTVTRLSDGASGQMRVVCNWTLTLRMAISVPLQGGQPGAPEIRELQGTGPQTCTWDMRLPGSTLVGTLAGTMALGLVSPTVGSFSGDLAAAVVGGTGEYARATGTGSFVQREEYPLDLSGRIPANLPIPAIPAIPPGVVAPGAAPTAIEHAFRAMEDGSRMTLTIRAGRPTARIVLPAPRLARASAYRLQVATTPGARCTATARRGTRKLALGRAADPDRDGRLVVGPRLAGRLGSGTWVLGASCTVRGGTAAATARVAIG